MVLIRALQTLVDAPPPRYVLPAGAAAHTRQFVPTKNWIPAADKEKKLILDGFRTVAPDCDLEIWWRATLDGSAFAALAQTAGRLPYLGRSESLCTAHLQLSDEPPAFDAVPLAGEPAPGTTLRELLSFSGGATVDETAGISITQLRAQRLRIPERTRWVTYAIQEPAATPPREHSPASEPGPTIARYRIIGGARPGMREAITVTEAARRALQHWFGRLNDGGTSGTFSGHDALGRAESDQHAHAHYLATGSAGRIDHLTVWANRGFTTGEVAALARLTRLTDSRLLPEGLDLALTALGTAQTLGGLDLCASARVWRTVTPIVLGRHPKRRGGRVLDSADDQIRRELGQRSHSDPIRIDPEAGRWNAFRTRRPTGTRAAPIGVLGARIEFEQDETGAIALGALAHFGLGLFVPVTTPEPEPRG